MSWIARAWDRLHRHHADSYVLVMFLAMALGLLAFLMLASQVRDGEAFAFDRWLLLTLRDPADLSVVIGPRWIRLMLTDLTSLGGTPVLTLITTASAVYLLVAKRAETALFVVLAISAGAAVSTSLKLVFARARPDLVQHLVEVTNASFPSGHAMNSAVTYLTLGALLARTEKEPAIRIYLIALAIALTLVIGFSRVYLGVHWPSDVVAGWCLGAAWAILCSLAARGLQQRRLIETES